MYQQRLRVVEDLQRSAQTAVGPVPTASERNRTDTSTVRGFDAMMRGDGDVVSGWKNKLQSAIANVTPAGVLAEQHRRMAEPGSGGNAKE